MSTQHNKDQVRDRCRIPNFTQTWLSYEMIQERDVLQIKDEEEKLQIEEEDKDEEYKRYNTCCRGSRSISADQPFFFFLIGISRSTLTKTNGKDEEPGNQQTSKPWRERESPCVCVCELVFSFG